MEPSRNDDNLQEFLLSKSCKIDLSNTCRLCLSDTGSDSVDIFTDLLHNYSMQVNEMFRTEITPIPSWPETACRNCVTKIEEMQQFKETVISTQTQLLGLVQNCIKTEEEAPDDANPSMTIWCQPNVAWERTEDTTQEGFQETDHKESGEEDYNPDDEQHSHDYDSEADDSSSSSEDDSEDESASDSNTVPKRKYHTNPKMPEDDDKLALEQIFKSMGLLSCTICLAETSFIAELVKHVREHHDGIKYDYCCGLCLRSVPGVYSHMRFHQNPDVYKCETCQKQFTTAPTYNAHVRQHETDFGGGGGSGTAKAQEERRIERRPRSITDKALLKSCKKRVKKTTVEEISLIEEMRQRNLLHCHVCDQQQETLLHLYIHTMEQHQIRGFIECCGRRLASIRYAYDHMRYHLNPDAFKCDQCDRRFFSWTERHQHKVRAHTLAEDHEFRCETCGTTFAAKARLTRHLNSHLPPNERRFPCNQCEKGYSTKWHLSQHISATHKSQSNILCETCGKGFTTNSHLQQHRRVHNKALKMEFKRRYEARIEALAAKIGCHLCGKMIGKMAMKKHLISCPGNGKQYICQHCGKQVKNQRSLSSHMRKHSENTSKKLSG